MTTMTNTADISIGHTKDDGIVIDYPGVRVILTPDQAVVFARQILQYVSRLKAHRHAGNGMKSKSAESSESEN